MDEIEVDFGDVKIKLPKAQAEAVIAERTALKAKVREAANAMGEIQAEAKAAAAKAKKAEEDKEIAAALAKGEIDRAKEIQGREFNEQKAKLASKYRDKELESIVRAHPRLVAMPDAAAQTQLVQDIVAQLRPSCRHDLEADRLRVYVGDQPAVGVDGSEVRPDGFVSSFLDARPYYLKPSVSSPGSGSDGSRGGKPTTVGKMSQADYDRAMTDPVRSFAVSKAVASGAIQVSDD